MLVRVIAALTCLFPISPVAAQSAVSIRGALELIPGTVLQPPGLENAETFALRSVPTSSSAAITVGGPSAADIAAFGTSFVLDGVPISNNANLQSIGDQPSTDTPARPSGRECTRCHERSVA